MSHPVTLHGLSENFRIERDAVGMISVSTMFDKLFPVSTSIVLQVIIA
jgi:hypothetical protein